MKDNWKTIRKEEVSNLIEARKALHQVVQLVSAFPRKILPADPTDESASLVWSEKLGGLQSNATDDDINVSIALSFVDFKLLILQGENLISELSMEGKSVNEGLEWLKSETSKLSQAGDQINLDLPYEIESYDYSQALHSDVNAIDVYTALFSNSNQILQAGVSKWENAHDVRCWPHHFDLATLIPFQHDENGELTKSIGIGMSPGDDGINEPYFYVNIWPNVNYDELSKHSLENGHWNKKGWSGAVLIYTDFVDRDQKSIVQNFIESVIQILRNQ